MSQNDEAHTEAPGKTPGEPGKSTQAEEIGGAVFEKLTPRELERSDLALPEMKGVRLPEVSDYNPLRALDDARWKLARGLLIILFLVIILNVGMLTTTKLTGAVASDITSMFETMFTAIITLVSAATGFYFGARTTSGSNGGTQQPGRPSATRKGP